MALAPNRLPVFTPIEREVLILSAVWELADNMVNRHIMRLHFNNPNSSIRFSSDHAGYMFAIHLVDLLSKPSDQITQSANYLEALRVICADPAFRPRRRVRALSKPVNRFHRWINATKRYPKLWLPSINSNRTLRMRRKDYLKITGNLAKHNFTRLDRVANDWRRILLANRVNVSLEQALESLEDAYEHFNNDIFLYNSHEIAELVNNIRSGIYEYLLPEYRRSYYRPANVPDYGYAFHRPTGINSDFAFKVYWDLMNKVRSGLRFMERDFVVDRFLKMRY